MDIKLKKLISYWLIVTFIFGILYALILPPFQSPDENNHFERIYHISQGNFMSEVSPDKQMLGGYLPEGIRTCIEPYKFMIHKIKNKISPDTVLSHTNKPFSSKKLEFIHFPNTARYAFTSYLPQTISTFLLDKFDTPPLIMMYAGRISAFLFWLFTVCWAIRITPVYKELFMFLTFLPTSMAVHTTLSADVVSNTLAFLIMALCLKFKFEATPIKRNDLILFSIAVLLLTWQKLIFFPLSFLLLLVPKAKFGGMQRKILIFTLLLIVSMMIVFWWNGQIQNLVYPTNDKLHTTYNNMRMECNNINPTLQKEYIMSHFEFFINDFIAASFKVYYYSKDLYLTSFGWESRGIPNGLMYILQCSIIIFILTRERIFKNWEIVCLALLAHGLLMLFLLSQHLHWACIGENVIYAFGGKYYIPIYPLIFMVLSGLLHKNYRTKKGLNVFNMFFIILMLVVQVDMLILLVKRYYL